MNTQNSNTYEALKHYINFPVPPNYAVFLSGAWGTGKTYFINRLIQNELTKSGDYIYISLYGLSTIKEIDNAIFKKIYPRLSSKTSNLLQKAIRAALGVFKVNIDIELQQLISLPKSKVYIFDDFERCDIPHEQILGYINNLVEHDKLKSIIIGNEDEIPNSEKYRIKREKLIGRTYQIVPEFDSAWDSFLASTYSNRSAKTLNTFKKIISEIYIASEVNNLRILQQTIWDYARLYDCLSDTHKNHEMAMQHLIQIIFVLAFEIKAGRISKSELSIRREAARYGFGSPEPDDPSAAKLWRVAERYSPIQIESSLISDMVLVDLLIKGHVVEGAVRDCLNQSMYFANPTLCSWKLVWHATEITEELFYEALADFNKKFEVMEYKNPNELMHVFGLKLWLAASNIILESVEDVKSSTMQYVDNLLATGQLSPLFAKLNFNNRFASHDGLGYMHGHTEDFKDLANYLVEKRLEAGTNLYPRFAHELMTSLHNDPGKTEDMLLGSNNEIPYRALPFLAHLNTSNFLDSILRLTPAAQQATIRCIALRYSELYLNHKLSQESSWVLNFITALQNSRATMSALGRARTNRLIYGYLKPMIKDYPELESKLVFDDVSEV